MRLYATVTSERASKSQGGNEELRIVIKDETQAEIFSIEVIPDIPDETTTEINIYTSKGEHLRYFAEKGKKQ